MLRQLVNTVLLLVFATGIAVGAESETIPRVLGSYSGAQLTTVGRETHVLLHLRLENPGAQAVSIERLTLLSRYPAATRHPATPISLAAHSRLEIDEEFTVPTPDSQSWQRGMRPALHLEMRTDTGAAVNQVVRLRLMPARGER